MRGFLFAKRTKQILVILVTVSAMLFSNSSFAGGGGGGLSRILEAGRRLTDAILTGGLSLLLDIDEMQPVANVSPVKLNASMAEIIYTNDRRHARQVSDEAAGNLMTIGIQ